MTKTREDLIFDYLKIQLQIAIMVNKKSAAIKQNDFDAAVIYRADERELRAEYEEIIKTLFGNEVLEALQLQEK